MSIDSLTTLNMCTKGLNKIQPHLDSGMVVFTSKVIYCIENSYIGHVWTSPLFRNCIGLFIDLIL